MFAAAILGILPCLGLANVTCDFETACPEGETCGDDTHSVTILSEMNPFEMMELNRAVEPLVVYLPENDRFELAEGGTGKVLCLANRSDLTVSFSTADQFHLVSFMSNGNARLSVHSEKSSTVYLGSCLAG